MICSTLELEEINSKQINIVCISDARYIKHLKNLLKSLHYAENHAAVHLCLINIILKKRLEKKLLSIYPNLNIQFLNKKFNYKHEKRAFCANHRVDFIEGLLKQQIDSIIYIDADSIIRGKISYEDLFDENFDIKIHFRNETDYRMKVATGVIAIKNNLKSKQFFQDWRKAITPLKFNWFADQITFHKLYEQHKNNMNFSYLNKTYIDWDFEDESIIWAGKGNRKYKNQKYLKESKKILRKSLKDFFTHAK